MTLFSNFSNWDSSSSSVDWGGNNNNSNIYGQILNFKDETIIKNISMWIKPNDTIGEEETFKYMAYLWEWDGTKIGTKIWNSVLLESERFDNNDTFKEIKISLDGIILRPNVDYVFCVVSSTIIEDENGLTTNSLYSYVWGQMSTDSLDETGIIVAHNGTESFQVGQHVPSSDGWSTSNSVSVITIEIDNPEPRPTPLSIIISSSKIYEHIFELTFRSNYDIDKGTLRTLTVNDIEVSGGILLYLYGERTEYQGIFISDDTGKSSIHVPEGVFYSAGSLNEKSNMLIINTHSPQKEVLKKKTDKERSRLVNKILKLNNEPEVISILTYFKALYSNNTISVSKQRYLELFLKDNLNYPRGVLMRILDCLEEYSLSDSSKSLSFEIAEYEKLETMTKLLNNSLGQKIMDTYIVNQNLDIFRDLGYLRHYLNTEFSYQKSSLVFTDKVSLREELTKDYMLYFDSVSVSYVFKKVSVNGSFIYEYDRTQSKHEFIRSAYEIMKQNQEVIAFEIMYTDASQEIPLRIYWLGGNIYDVTNDTYSNSQLFTYGESLDWVSKILRKRPLLYREDDELLDLNNQQYIIATLITDPDNLIIMSDTENLYMSMNIENRYIVDFFHELSSHNDSMTDFRTLDNSTENSSGLNLRNMKLHLIKNELLLLLFKGEYFNDTFYGVPVSNYNLKAQEQKVTPSYQNRESLIRKIQPTKNKMRLSPLSNLINTGTKKRNLSMYNNSSIDQLECEDLEPPNERF